jgi:guanosine-3',5'-bis(diphosphate) 3'-pyrophosphohydrolase
MKLEKNGITARVTGRRKKPFSIWTKMKRKSVGFEQLSDIYGFRVVLPDLEACYRALGVVHTTWPVVPGRFKDYISTPKQNDYRSIHTTVIGPGNQRVELQIRTEDMNRIAEYGIAAHAFYKDGIGSPTEMLNRESNAFSWLRHTIGILSESTNPEEFLEHTKLELFHDQVFCFTPKGKQIALPRNANVVDFAYAVHTDVGNSAVGCKINGKFAPLSSELQNGDEVEVLTSAAQQAPPSAWESLAVTGKARAAIRRATRTAVRDQYASLGRRIVERLFVRAKIEYSDDQLKGALPRLARASIDDVMASSCAQPTSPARCIPTTRKSALVASRPTTRSPRPTRSAHPTARHVSPRSSRSAASIRICRSNSRRMAAPCRATASSAS